MAAANRPPVMLDVARLAGVSHQTVSRVLNDHPNVRPATRERVLRAVEQLAYRPNQMARALVTRRSGRVGVISLESQLFGPASSLLGIEQAAREAGYAVTVGVVDAESRRVAEAAAAMADQAVEGVIVIAPSAPSAASFNSLPAGMPIIAVQASIDAPVPVAAVDQYLGGRLATEHLLELGHRTVWHVSGPADWSEAREREAAWRDTLGNAGVPAPRPIPGNWSPASGFAAGQELIRQRAAGAEVTAVFVANDDMAVGLLSACHQAGMRVPEDVSVVGFDDIPQAAYLVPALTTVRQDFAAVGRLGMALLLSLIEGPQDGETQNGELQMASRVIEPVLTVRASTSAPLGHVSVQRGASGRRPSGSRRATTDA